MTRLDELKIKYAEAAINLKQAKFIYDKVESELVQELNLSNSKKIIDKCEETQ